jgi:hypothetical protein
MRCGGLKLFVLFCCSRNCNGEGYSFVFTFPWEPQEAFSRTLLRHRKIRVDSILATSSHYCTLEMSEVEKAMEEVVDAVVASSTPEQEESFAQVRSSPAKNQSNKESQDEATASVEEPQLSDNVPADSTVTPKRTTKERREGAKALKEAAAAAASDDSQTEHTDAQVKGRASSEAVPMSLEPGVASPDEPAKKRKPNSKQRRSLRAREAAAAANSEPTASAQTTAEPSTGSESPKSNIEPPLPARTKKVAVKTEGATQQSRTSEDATAAKGAVQDTAKPAEREPKKAAGVVKAPVAASAPPANTAYTAAIAKEASKSEPTNKAAAPATASTAEAPAPTAGPSTGTTTPQETKPTKLRPVALKPDQLIAVHALLALLQQQVFADATLVTANSGALKSHLLHGIAKLGYTCLEGTAESFQRVAWHAADNYMDYSPPIVKAPEQFVQSSKTKGDLKLVAPALFVQLRAYPDFGALSPLLQGMKAFKSGFTRSIDEVAGSESDAFVFAAPQKVYQQFALQAVPTMPALSDIAKHAKTVRFEFTNKDGAACTLRCVASRVEKAMGDDYIVVAVLP